MKVFMAGTSLDPAYGGPAYSVSRLATALVDVGIDVGLWSPDGSAISTDLVPRDSLVMRLAGSEREALDRFGEPDVIHDNGLWRSHNHRLCAIASSRRIPRVVSTRGMLEPWAVKHKWLKKRIAWWVYQRRDLMKTAAIHATSATELRNLSGLLPRVPLQLIPNGVDLPDPRQTGQRIAETPRIRTALFVGRIYPVKGLPMLVQAWARVRPDRWRLKIVGPDESGHRREVERAVAAAGLENEISFPGQLSGDEKDAAFRGADLFVLPTHSESFGMAIAEALSYGLPVLTTTGAPWAALAEHGCGWQVEPTVDGIERGLRTATALDSQTMAGMGKAGRVLVDSEYRWSLAAARFVHLYEQVTREGNGVPLATA